MTDDDAFHALQAFGSGVLTDLYEITMSAVYHEKQPETRAVFELWIRDLPPTRGYLLAAGLAHAVDYIQTFHFSDDDVAAIAAHPSFSHISDDFFEMLRTLRFTGDLWAMPEGTVFFPGEPLLRVEAPIIEAQILETALLACVTYNTSVATKASRIWLSATCDGKQRDIIEFGARRAPGPGASVYAARAAYIGGFTGTSNVYAGKLFGIPTSGTMAHSFVMSYDDELTAFRDYYAQYPNEAVLLLDTYDTLEAARNVSAIGKNVKAVRLDSGNILALSQKVRKILDDTGMTATRIFVSGDLDEYRIAELIEKGACIDGFGVGTRLVTCDDAPSLSAIYKLVEIQRGEEIRPVAKFSEGKETYPGRKQVVRFGDASFDHDLVMHADESVPEGGVPLLEKMIENGNLIKKLPSLEDSKKRAAQQLERLQKGVKARHKPDTYDVRISTRLEALRRRSADEKVK